jgi:hypothetical protein
MTQEQQQKRGQDFGATFFIVKNIDLLEIGNRIH